MDVLGIVGSARKGHNTDTLVRKVISEMSGIDPLLTSEVVYTADLQCAPCRVVCHAEGCASHAFRCTIDDDVMAILRRMERADALVIGAPQYFRAPPAGFHTMIERMQAMAFFHEAAGGSPEASPYAGLPCGLVAVAEYTNPHGILEYLHDFCLLLKMRPVGIPTFPYLGVGAHGKLEEDTVFRPLVSTHRLAEAVVAAVAARS